MTDLHKIRAAQVRAAEQAAIADLPPELLASVAPAVQAPEGGPAVDERAAFEDFASDDGDLLSLPNMWQRDARGNYAYASMQTAWTAWQARAALAAQPQAEPAGEPAAWLVLDRDGSLIHAAAWREAAHDHINDAISEYGISEAACWVVRPAFTAPQTKEQPSD